MVKIPVWAVITARILAILYELLLCLILLELGLRLAGSAVLSWQEHRNRVSIQQKGTYRIMCLGESTTAAGGIYSYPSQLQEVLNQRGIGVKFSVINEGVPGVHTSDILNRLEFNLNTYRPDMVISMMGAGDLGSYVLYETVSGSKAVNFFRSLRIYKSTRIFWLHIAAARSKPRLFKNQLQQISMQRENASSGKELLKLEKAIERDPANDRGYVEIGAFYRDQGKLVEAEAALRKAIELDPYNDGPYFELGWICRVQGKFSEAEALFTKVIEINPKNYWPYVERGKFSEAEALFRKAIARDPRNTWLYIGLGWIYRDQGKFSEAEALFRKAIKFNSQNYWLYLELGLIYREQGKLSDAEAVFNKNIALNPRNDRAYFELGWVYERQGRYSEAEAAFKKAVEINPKNDGLYAGLGRFYLERGKFLEAEAAFKKAIEINPENDSPYVGLGQSYRDQGRFLDAEEAFREALELNPKNDGPYVGIGWVYQDQGKLTEAEAVFKKAIEINPQDYLPYFKLGAIYRDQGRLFEAEAALKKSLELNSRNDRAFGALRVLYAEMGNSRLSREYEKKANELRSDYYPQVVTDNYHKLKAALDKRGVVYVCAQYPLRGLEPLKKIFQGNAEGIIFVDNQKVFQEALKGSAYKEYFTDMVGGDFGHCTPRGNRLLAENIANAILDKVFSAQSAAIPLKTGKSIKR